MYVCMYTCTLSCACIKAQSALVAQTTITMHTRTVAHCEACCQTASNRRSTSVEPIIPDY